MQESISVAIPTYGRNKVLVDTISALFEQYPGPREILVIDQTLEHDAATQEILSQWHEKEAIRWLRLGKPSITRAMNTGLVEASNSIVLFLDDDIIPRSGIVEAHAASYTDENIWAVAGQVLQPGQSVQDISYNGSTSGVRASWDFPFNSNRSTMVQNVMAGNLSVRRYRALAIGGFDENFIGVAYRFETEFARRIVRKGGKILFQPKASIRHIRSASGGTRTYGNHLTSASPMHGVGDYYFALKQGFSLETMWYMACRPFREIRTRFHLRHPWWIPVKLVGEIRAMVWAIQLVVRGPRYLNNANRLQQTMKIRIAIVISHPIQHFAPMFRDLAKEPGVKLKVFYCCDWGAEKYTDPGFGQSFAWDVPLLEGYDYEFLPIRRRPRTLSFREIDNPAVGQRLNEFAPHAVWVHGYSHRTSWRVRRWARNRAFILYFGDSELLHRRPLHSRILKRIILPRFFRRVDAFITIGDNNEAYYRHYGVPDSKMYRGAYPVDISRFRNTVENLTDSDRAEIRKKYGLSPDSMVVLFVGKFIPIKRPLDLIDAMAGLKRINHKVEALFIGDGVMKPEIINRIRECGLGKQVKLAGFVNQSEMPQVLFAGDVLAMCSEKDPHPLAVTEAMAVGNAIVASDRVGCVGPTDAARYGNNALVYSCGQVKQLADKLIQLAEDAKLRTRMKQSSLELAWTQDTRVTVSAIVRAVRTLQDQGTC